MSYTEWETDWTIYSHNEWYESDSDGNEMEWDVQWKAHPHDTSYQALYTTLWVSPGGGWNRWCAIKHHYNESNAKVESYEPGNSVGQTADSWEMSFSSNGIVEVSLGEVDYGSEYEVDFTGETTGPEPENVDHKINPSGDLTNVQVECQSASVAEVNETSGETFANVELKAYFDDYWGYDPLTNSYHYYWA